LRYQLNQNGALWEDVAQLSGRLKRELCGCISAPEKQRRHMSTKKGLPRRQFLKGAAGAIGAATQIPHWSALAQATSGVSHQETSGHAISSKTAPKISYPRVFRGRELKMISFPMGGVGAGSLGLGGRGQLRDWEIFNRPDQGFSPSYAFPAIWIQQGSAKPIAHVLEARILPPYEGQDGLGSKNSPGLSRLEGATFSGEFPLANIKFEDARLPVGMELDAFTPFIPHDADESGLPVAVLRYRVTNHGHSAAKVAIAFSIDNPVSDRTRKESEQKRINEYVNAQKIVGLKMTNPGLSEGAPMQGSFVLAAMPESNTEVTHWRGWPKGGWWNSPLLFWDAFSAEGRLGTEPDSPNGVGALCQRTEIAPGQSASFTFLLAWHFPHRTPEWCGWSAPPGKEKAVIGNFYATRFADAWEAAQYTADNLQKLEERTRLFADAFRNSTLPDTIKEAASANLSTLVSTTCFRTADGEFHGFEGSDDTRGCCYGNCTHVWNYETATAFLFPALARSLRKAAFGYSEDDEGAIRARQVLPDGETRDKIVAADGHMGQIMHAYLDWRLSGDNAWLATMWPRIKKAIAFSWESNGWDPKKRGVLDGVQNNTYDVAFSGPNPMCSIYYLGALRVCEEMALATGDQSSAKEYRSLFEQGSRWIDANLFNGEFYVQHIRKYPRDEVAPVLLAGAEEANPENPQYQVGEGCLIDQLIGQYLAHVMALGPLVSEEHATTTLQSIYKYNYKRSLADHDNVQRTFVLNDEAAMVICDYGTAARPRIPFPYFAEVMTGFEHSTAALMIYAGMTDQGVECIHNIRARYDGEKRNPWDEAECGHHYARAMASWTSVVALSGFDFDGSSSTVTVVPRLPHREFDCFWSTGTGWGTFSYRPTAGGTRLTIRVLAGRLPCQSCEISGSGASTSVRGGGRALTHTTEKRGGRTVFHLNDPYVLAEGRDLQLEVLA
jgi:non-lysosomal glucosylceramidase